MTSDPSEQERTAFAVLEHALGEHPAEFANAAELAALMARLPADTPVKVARYVRVDPALHQGREEERVTAAATVVTDLQDQRIELDAQGLQRLGGRHVPVIELGTVIVAKDAPVSQDTVAFEPSDRAIEALHAGDVVTILDAYQQVTADIGGVLNGILDASLHEWIDDPDLRDQLRLEGDRFLHAAARLAHLRTLLAAHDERGRTGPS